MKWSTARASVLLLGALAVACSGVSAAGLDISPTLVRFAGGEQSDAISLVNGEDHPELFRVESLAWSQEAGKDRLTQTDDLLVIPPLLSVGANETGVVRIALRVTPAVQERAYRIVLTEVPPDVGKFAGALIVYRLSVPVFVAPSGRATQDLGWSARVAGKRRIDVTLTNRGNEHVDLLSLRLASDGASARTIGSNDGPGYVLAGRSRTFSVDLDRPYDSPNVAIEATDGSVPSRPQTLKATVALQR